MPIDIDFAGDFATIVDGAEPVTLLRRGSADHVAIATAWRYIDRHSEAVPAGGFAVQADVEWQFEWGAATKSPQIGDRVRDTSGECYTILAVNRLQGNTRLRCETRALRIAHGLDCLIDVERAVWDAGAINSWTTYRPAVHACIQPAETIVDETTDPATSIATYRILLDDDTPLDHNHRIVAGDGAVYRVLNHSQSERIDRLPVAVVRREI